jgi:SpoVK/Ycf46/Vps4 family AAA+-type ATPase
LDSVVKHSGKRQSLSKILTERLVDPLVAGRPTLEMGRALPRGSPTSAILYGPPGTSKTELAKLIAGALGWPLLALDPSHLTRRGLDRVHAEANIIFRMLEHSERIVVLLDEFDELVRERESSGQLESRFLTTAMLPKLAALSRERRLVYLVATNHLEQFDAAIRRPGRFYLIVPVMPPTTEAKLGKWPALASAVAKIKEADPGAATRARQGLRDLTYLEAEELAGAIATANKVPEQIKMITAAADACTLHQPVLPQEDTRDPTRQWLEQIESQSNRIRGI